MTKKIEFDHCLHECVCIRYMMPTGWWLKKQWRDKPCDQNCIHRIVNFDDNTKLHQLRVRIKRGQLKEFKDIPHSDKVVGIIIDWMNKLRDGKDIVKLNR